MQVSQQDDFITHAVIGNQESISMGVSDDAALMHILSSTLYTHPQLAVVREIICNAWDAHIAAGKTDTPVQITVNTDQIIVRDFGFGIPHAKIGPIYGVYGNSTKRDDDTVTGGFGLGSKAPFAYTDNFEVISHHLGHKTVYRVSKSSMEKGGKPSINKIVTVPTDETGIAVSFGLQKTDHIRFEKLIREVLQLGEITATINGQPVELSLPMSASPTGYLINDFRGTFGTRVNLRYGNVVYPIPEHEAYQEEYHRVYRAMDHLWQHANVIFMAPPDSISIAPSREALILTDGTVAVIKKLLSNFETVPVNSLQKSVVQVARTSINQQLEKVETPVLKDMLLRGSAFDTTTTTRLVQNHRTFSTFRKAGIAMTMEKGIRLDKELQLVKQLKTLIKRKEGNVPLMKKVVQSYATRQSGHDRRKQLRGILSRFVLFPLKQGTKNYPSLENCRTLVYQNPGYHCGQMYKNHGEVFRESNCLTLMLDRKALVARNAKEAEIFLDENHSYKNVSIFVWIVGSGKAAEQRTLDAIDLMTSLGYDVEMHFPEKEKKVKEVLPDGAPVPVVKRKKRGTFYSLTHSWEPGYRNFLLSQARSNYTDDTLIEEPLAWVILRPKNDSSQQLEHLSIETSRLILKEWGDKIAVVSQAQATQLKKQGVPSVTKFLRTYADDKLSSSPEFKRYAAFAYHARDSYRNTDKVMHAMTFHEPLMKVLNLRFSLSKDIGLLINMCHDRYHGFKDYPKCVEVLNQVKRHPKFEAVKLKMANSPVVDFISLDCLAGHLDSHDENDPGTKAAYEVIQLLLK